MRRLGSVATLSLLGTLGALLAGCPVWGPEPLGPLDGSGPRTDAATTDTSTRCDRNDQCDANQYCDPVGHVCVIGQSCSATSACPTGYFCDDRNVCAPGCTTNTDCATLSTALVCDTTQHRCVPGGSCQRDSECTTAGQVCVDGSCRAATTLCRYNYQCTSGHECVDGRCLTPCRTGVTTGAGSCPAGLACTSGYCQYPTGGTCGSCATSQVCAGGTCLAACTTDGQCGSGKFCDHGVCRVDDRRPAPFCTAPANGCATGSVCVDGVCRISCPGRTNEECQRRDVNFNKCDTAVTPTPICRYASEVMPQCQRSVDCGSGHLCVNALCR